MIPKNRLDAVLDRLSKLFPKEIDLSLDRQGRLLAALGAPETKLPPVVHIAGTNGKGSTLATLRAIAEEAGLRVHVYSSPHLVHFAERIRLAGSLIDDTYLVDILERVEHANHNAPITFFEATTIAAFLAFSEVPADLCLLETGLGGRLDATNVVLQPALTLISALSLDHQSYLGDTLAEIAFEKAGILKRNVPCLSAYQEDEARLVLQECAAKQNAPLFFARKDWQAEQEADPARMRFTLRDIQLDLPAPSLAGQHQFDNAGLALAAAHMLVSECGFPRSLIDPASLAKAMNRIEWPARLQYLPAHPLTALLPQDWQLWLDGGHNPGAGIMLAKYAQDHWQDRPLYLIVGMRETKDIEGFLQPLASCADALYSVSIPNDSLSLSAEDVLHAAQKTGFKESEAFADLTAALAKAAKQPGPARVLICGSLYLSGSVLALQ